MKKLFIALFCVTLLSACGTLGGQNLPYDVVGQTGIVKKGKVIAMKAVNVKAQTSYSMQTLGSTTGGALGAALGSKFGSGKGQQLATLIGGLAGAAAGSAAMENGHDRGTQFILTVDGYQTAVVLTANIDPTIRPGDFVQLVYFGSRVTNIYKI